MGVFGDCQCPACAKFETEYLPKLRPRAEKYGDFKLVFKHWPICPECNPYAKYNNHPKACLAAKAAEAARILGGNEGFWKMHDLLFSRQADIKAADTRWFLERARESGFDTAAFLKAMESKEAGDRIAAHTQEGEILGQGIVADERLEEVKVESTPAIYIDGKKVRSVQHNRTWRMIFASRPTAVPKSSSTSRPAATGTTPGYGVLAPDQIDDGDHR